MTIQKGPAGVKMVGGARLPGGLLAQAQADENQGRSVEVTHSTKNGLQRRSISAQTRSISSSVQSRSARRDAERDGYVVALEVQHVAEVVADLHFLRGVSLIVGPRRD
jgi:hypothetical protein